MGTARISVIIPAYNAGSYIGTCLGSICSGTFGDMEILVVDDGSEDDTIRRVESVSQHDDRICLISMNHKGVGAARNKGLEEAQGEYIAFIDADDRVETDYLSKLLNYADDNQLDWVACNYVIETCDNKQGAVNNQIVLEPCFSDHTIIRDDIGTQVRQAIFAGPQDNILSSVAMGLYRTDRIRESRVKFREDISYGEDILFNYELSHHLQSFGYVPEALYRYNRNLDSATEKTFSENLLGQQMRLLEALEKSRRNYNDPYASENLSYAAIQIRQIFQFDILLRGNKEEREEGYQEFSTMINDLGLTELWGEIGQNYRASKLTHRIFFDLLSKEKFDAIDTLQPLAKRMMKTR